MSPRPVPARIHVVFIAALLAAAVAGCAGGTAPSPTTPATQDPGPTPVAVPTTPDGPSLTPVPVATPTAEPDPTADPDPTPTPITGGVDGSGGGPSLTVVPAGDRRLQVTLDDPAAKAWRVVVSGTGDRTADRWEIVVETGDVAPVITATEFRAGEAADVLDLSGFLDGTAAAGGCHATLPVCIDSDGFRLPDGGDGRFSVRLDIPERGVPLVIRGGTAGWPGEPFVLGPWLDTDALTWGG